MAEDTPPREENTNYDGFDKWVQDPYEPDGVDLPPTPSNLFRPGMAIELNESNYPSMWCVGSIKRVSGEFVLAHFDGWGDAWDVWYRWDASEMRPVGTCAALRHQLDPPFQGPDADIWSQTGDWDSYLAHKNNLPAPIEAFSPLFVSDSDDGSIIQSLQALAANKVASIKHCFVYLDCKIGHNLFSKLQNAKLCCICQESYLIGFRCVKAFTLQKYLKCDEHRPLHTGTVCSSSCLFRFNKDYIGYLQKEKIQFTATKNDIDLYFGYLLAIESSRNPKDTEPSPEDHPSPSNLFRVGMKIESVDSNYPDWYCACTVLRSCGDEVLVNFDGWGPHWDMWCDWRSPKLRPIGTSKRLGANLSIGFPAREVAWSEYAEEIADIAAPVRAFSKLYVCEFGDHHGGIAPLSILAINTLLQCTNLNCHIPNQCAQIFPFTVNGSPFRIRTCSICSKSYFQGWMAVKPFTLPTNFRIGSTILLLCSRNCLRQFHLENIGDLV